MQPDQNEDITTQISTHLTSSRHSQRRLSFATHGATVLIVIFSSTAAVLSQTAFTYFLPSYGWATTLLCLAVLISIPQSGFAFERKWIGKRMKHSALEQLEIDRLMGEQSQQLSVTLCAILKQHNKITRSRPMDWLGLVAAGVVAIGIRNVALPEMVPKDFRSFTLYGGIALVVIGLSIMLVLVWKGRFAKCRVSAPDGGRCASRVK